MRVGRREFLFGSLSGSVLAQSLMAPAASTLTMLTPADGTVFDSSISTFFPAIAGQPNFASEIRPFLVLLRNNTALTAKGYDVRWMIKSDSGSVVAIDNYFVQRHRMPRKEAKTIEPS